MLLSVEELELLVIRHVFENHLHFLAFVAHFPSTFSCHHQAITSTVLNINDQTVWSGYMQIWSWNTFL
jgi:hypothetical protein